jgi:hypothetical protein
MSQSVVLRLNPWRRYFRKQEMARGIPITARVAGFRTFPGNFKDSLTERIHQYRDVQRPRESQSHPYKKQSTEVAFAVEPAGNRNIERLSDNQIGD